MTKKMKIYNIIYVFLFSFLIMGDLFAKSSSCGLPKMGDPGPRGHKGIVGPPGPTGPTGPFGLGNSLSLSLQNIQAVADQSAVLFDLLNQNQGAISYNAATGVIVLNNTGIYQVSFGITATTSNRQFGLRINGSLPLLDGSTIDSESSDMVGMGLFFEVTSPMSTLELFNNSGSNTTLQTSTMSSMSAFLNIYQIR